MDEEIKNAADEYNNLVKAYRYDKRPSFDELRKQGFIAGAKWLISNFESGHCTCQNPFIKHEGDGYCSNCKRLIDSEPIMFSKKDMIEFVEYCDKIEAESKNPLYEVSFGCAPKMFNTYMRYRVERSKRQHNNNG